jgi:hypothetical protein
MVLRAPDLISNHGIFGSRLFVSRNSPHRSIEWTLASARDCLNVSERRGAPAAYSIKSTLHATRGKKRGRDRGAGVAVNTGLRIVTVCFVFGVCLAIGGALAGVARFAPKETPTHAAPADLLLPFAVFVRLSVPVFRVLRCVAESCAARVLRRGRVRELLRVVEKQLGEAAAALSAAGAPSTAVCRVRIPAAAHA